MHSRFESARSSYLFALPSEPQIQSEYGQTEEVAKLDVVTSASLSPECYHDVDQTIRILDVMTGKEFERILKEQTSTPSLISRLLCLPFFNLICALFRFLNMIQELLLGCFLSGVILCNGHPCVHGPVVHFLRESKFHLWDCGLE